MGWGWGCQDTGGMFFRGTEVKVGHRPEGGLLAWRAYGTPWPATFLRAAIQQAPNTLQVVWRAHLRQWLKVEVGEGEPPTGGGGGTGDFGHGREPCGAGMVMTSEKQFDAAVSIVSFILY